MVKKSPSVLLVHPWIHDFAAYDLWLRPVGLLRIAALLRGAGIEVFLLDCLDRYNPALLSFLGRDVPRRDTYGCGSFHKEEIQKPAAYETVDRRYFRYGLPVSLVTARLKEIPSPDVIIVSSTMTYWYPGTFQAIEILKECLRVPVVLGGIYPTLCESHAHRHSGADVVFTGSDIQRLFTVLSDFLPSLSLPDSAVTNEVYPAYDLMHRREALAIATSRGCPFRCSYCASHIVQPDFFQKEPEAVVREIHHYCQRYKTRDIAFYDDALLAEPEQHIKPILKHLISRNLHCRLHSPNGLHARFIDSELAELMKESNFTTIRLSLETSSPERQKKTGNKVTTGDVKNAISLLIQAGFNGKDIEVYTMLGMPGQTPDDVVKDIMVVSDLGVKSVLASYSPVPGTRDWECLVQDGTMTESTDPLLHNNTTYPVLFEGYSTELIRRLRRLASVCNYATERGIRIFSDPLVRKALRRVP